MQKLLIKKIFITFTIISTVIFSTQIFFLAIEPDLAIAATATDNVVVTLNVISGITISNGADSTMTPNLGRHFRQGCWFIFLECRY